MDCMKRDERIRHFTHTDLDGVGCAIMSKAIYKHSEVSFCDYNNIDKRIVGFITKYMDSDGSIAGECPYDMILITDISVNPETAELLDMFRNTLEIEVVLLDHHLNLEWLVDGYGEWARVAPLHDSGLRSSGTSLLMEYIINTSEVRSLAIVPLIEFSETVRLYDTWEWVDSATGQNAKDINDLLYIIGRERFMDRFSTDPITVILDSHETYLLEIERDRIDRLIKSKLQNMRHVSIGSHNVGLVFSETHQSELGHAMCKHDENIDYAMIINVSSGSVSLRTSKDVDLSIIARKFGGGGHKSAAGFTLNSMLIESSLESMIT